MKKEKFNIEDLPLYSDPSLVIAGDKAKFSYNKANTDWAVVEIISVENSNNCGFNICWKFILNPHLKFRTYVRPGNPSVDEPICTVGTTIPLKMVKRIINVSNHI